MLTSAPETLVKDKKKKIYIEDIIFYTFMTLITQVLRYSFCKTKISRWWWWMWSSSSSFVLMNVVLKCMGLLMKMMKNTTKMMSTFWLIKCLSFY